MCPESKLTEEFIESGNVVRTNMRLGHTLDVGVASSTGQSTDTIVVYHPTYVIVVCEREGWRREGRRRGDGEGEGEGGTESKGGGGRKRRVRGDG